MVMLFMNPTVRNFLLSKGYVYTFRIKRHNWGKDWATDKRAGRKLCDIFVENEWRVSGINDLRPFVHASGFDSIGEWVEAIKQFNPKLKFLEGFVYLVCKS